jgi:hypothetical protein
MPFPMFFNTIPKKYHLPSGNDVENKSFYHIDFALLNFFNEFYQAEKLISAGQLVFFWH